LDADGQVQEQAEEAGEEASEAEAEAEERVGVLMAGPTTWMQPRHKIGDTLYGVKTNQNFSSVSQFSVGGIELHGSDILYLAIGTGNAYSETMVFKDESAALDCARELYERQEAGAK
jgi:hypothetical protein